MKSSFMEHKGYLGSVEYDEAEEIFFGKVMFVGALISYEGTNASNIKTHFREAVDDYLTLCAERGLKPEKPLKGSFNVRTSPELHRRAVLYAAEHSKKLNNVVEDALEEYLGSRR